MRLSAHLNARFAWNARRDLSRSVRIAAVNWCAGRAERLPPHREPRMLTDHIERIAAGTHLTRAEAESIAEELLTGKLADADIARLLSSLRDKSECVDELVGFATVMRRHARPVFPDLNSEQRSALANEMVDTCGTGGSGRNTFNISTA